MSVSEKMKAIADAIREYTNKPDKLTLDEMPNEIHVAAGQAYQDGIRGGTAEGIEQGKKEAYDEFWDTIQAEGTHRNYESAFVFWQDKIFYPKYDIVVPSGGYPVNHMFYRFNGDIWYNSKPFNLSQRLKECGKNLDTSKATSFNYTFSSSGITHIPELSTVNATTLYATFYGATKLQTIENLILKADGSQTFSTTFTSCSSLENIMIGAPRKGATCSELITVPFNEAFEWIDEDDRTYANLKPEWLDAYAEYITASDSELYPRYLQTYICFETGEHYVAERYIEDIEGGYGFRVPRWWIPKDETQNVSFYLCKNEEDAFTRESIGNNIDFKSCPLSCRSISCIVSALSSTASGKTLTLKKSAVENAFGIDADGYSDDMYWFVLVADKSNEYDGNWTISLV